MASSRSVASARRVSKVKVLGFFVTLVLVGSLSPVATGINKAFAAVAAPNSWGLLAAGERSTVLGTETGSNQTVLNNGTYFYNNPSASMGFAASASISQGSADVLDSSLGDGSCSVADGGAYRLSWHRRFGDVRGGWRYGCVTSLNSDNSAVRAVFQSDSPSYYPAGPQLNVSNSTVVNSGWEQCYLGGYGTDVAFSTITSSCTKTYILLAGGVGSSVPVLSAPTITDDASTSSSVSVTFASVSNASSYTAYVYSASSGGAAVKTVTNYVSGASITGLSEATTYYVTVASVGDNVNYATSAESSPRSAVATTTPTYTATFDSNGGTGSMADQVSSSSTGLATNSFARAGFLFGGWNTEADGTGTDYANEATFPFTSSDTLYAQWLKLAPPVEASYDAYVQPGDADGATATNLILKNAVDNTTSVYNRVSYARFEYDPDYSWTNAAFEMLVVLNSDGSTPNGWGTSYTTFNVDVWGIADAGWGDSLRFSSANASAEDWGINTDDWPWSPNGGTHLGTISIPTDSDTVGETYALSNAALVSFLNSDSDGEVTLFFRRSDIDNQANLQFASLENTTVGYHGPRLVTPSGSYSYSIAYDINGGSGTLPNPGTYTLGSPAYTIQSPASVTPPSGKAFAGWNSAADGSGTAFAVGASYSTAASATLYAQYSSNPVITFLSNNGGSLSSFQAVPSGVATALTANSFSRDGYSFAGWNTVSDGSGTPYGDEANVTAASALTLYAQWSAVSSGSGGSGGTIVTPTPVVDPTTPAVPRIIAPTLPTSRPSVLGGPVSSPGRGFDPNTGTRATVGGAPATVVKRALPGGVSVQTGAFQFGVSLGDNEDNTVDDGVSDLGVAGGGTAKVTGSGMLPGSPVQVWLPGPTGTESRELARATVNEDGQVEADLAFVAKPSDTAIAIGPQVMQVTGYDDDGNLTVVDMTINVSQGPVTPEPDRSEGALPALSVGSSLVTSAGIPTPVTVVPLSEEKRVSIGDGSWTLLVDVDPETGVVGGTPEAPVVQVTQDSVGSASGLGFRPGTTASVWMFSDPTLLGTVTVAEDGSFTAEFQVDSTYLPVGTHTLQIQGVGDDGYIKAANLGVDVQAPADLTATGSSGLLWWVAGIFALLLAVLPLAVMRRRRGDRVATR